MSYILLVLLVLAGVYIWELRGKNAQLEGEIQGFMDQTRESEEE